MGAEQTSRDHRPIAAEEQILYDHWLYWVELESPDQLIERFRRLFIEGSGYPEPAISQALNQITASDLAADEFRYVLNRCCHILINRWQTRPHLQPAIPQLVNLFEAAARTNPPHSGSARRLRQLLKQFIESEQYITLRRLAAVFTGTAESGVYSGKHPLGTLICRYPYLYHHCLLSEDGGPDQQHMVRRLQGSVQRQFEVNLSQYLTYQVRRSRPNFSRTAPALIQPVANPTLLSDRELGQAIRHYVGKVDGCRTHKDMAHRFLTHVGVKASFKTFKEELYQYLTTSIEPSYGKRRFNQQLHLHLNNILPDHHSAVLNDFLMVRTCMSLLNFLVIDSPQSPNHFIFVDLTTNIGPILTTGVLLKIVLLCRKVKPYLEKRFSILFNHYEAQAREAVSWLIQALENLNIALTTHFGSIHLAFPT